MGGYEFQRAELDALERVVLDESAQPMSLSLPLLRHITNDFSPESEIGTDEFAVVYLGLLPSGFRVAVKKLHHRYWLDEEAGFKNEVSIAMKAAHKNTVRLIGYCHHTQDQIADYEGKQVFAGVQELLICMEYVPNSTLYRHVEGKICTGMDIYEFQSVELDALERVVRDESAEPMNLTLPLLRHITNDFSPESEIGSGGYAVVYLGVLPSGLRIAVKKLHQIHADDSLFLNEVSITMKTAHKHTVRLIGYCSHIRAELVEHNGQHVFVTTEERLICLEYVPYGSLYPHIDNYRGGLDWSQRYQILKGICQGLHHLHDELHVFHGDIKPYNILIGENLVPKIIDFGLSRCMEEGEPEGYIEIIVGTFGYMAPEMVAQHRWSTKSDIYSFGVIVTELITGERWPQPTVQVLKQLRKRLVEEGAFSSWENGYQQIKTCLEIGYTCMEIDPDKRPTALEIIRLLDETECPNHSAPSLWQSLDEESDSSVTEALETETTTDFLPSDEEPASSDTTGETSTQEPDKPDLVSNLPVLVELSDLKFLEKITDGFSHKRIVGKDGTRTGYAYPKAFVYKGKIPRREMIAVKRLIGVRIQAETFMSKAQQFMSLDHKNIVKVAGYCQDESTTYRRVHFKGEPEPIPVVIGPEQLVCYEYMQKGSLQEYLIGQRYPEIDWHIRYKLIKGTCEGLRYLHNDGGIVHLNLSPSNVLLDDNNGPRITGFDFSKLIGERNTKSVTVQTKGSALDYLPPDFFHKKDTDYNYFCKVDIYSLGLMIIEIVTQEKIKAYDHARLITSVEENWRQESQLARLYTSLEADKLWQVKLCIDIGLRCVKSVPEMRPTARNIVRWLDKGSKPVAAPRAGAGVPRPPVRTSVNRDDHSQGMKKLTGFMEQLFRRK